MDEGRRFWAFLSYSHKDREWAAWLHRALETYVVPARLIGRPSPGGPAPKRLRPVFKDREDLAASAGLRTHVDTALKASCALVVICSPAAAASAWVEEEIVRFKTLRGEDRVFAVIVEGTPNASRVAGTESAECFPAALRFVVDSTGALTGERAELVAADLRPGGDGRRLARLKLIAGILDLDLDELVQRDAHRRAERLTALTAASVAGTVLMGGLALAALASRDEARAQRAQAEGLVEFMLGDLRKKLEPTGRLDVLDAVGGRAMAYYSAQAGHGLDDHALGRRARVLHLLGEIQEKRGNLDAARQEFSEASVTTAELLARNPRSTERIFNHAQSVYYVGEIADVRGDDGRALAAFLEYKGLVERLIASEPGNVDWQSELADANINLGSLLLKRHRAADAMSAFARALAIERNLSEKAPHDQDRRTQLAEAYSWLSDAEAMAGDDASALRDRLAERRIVERALADNPDDNAAAEALMVNLRVVAGIYLRSHDLREAVAELSRSSQIAERLIATDRANVQYQSDAALSFIALGGALLDQRVFGPAMIAAKRADSLTEGLAAKDPTVEAWAGVHLGAARLLRLRIAAETAKDSAGCRRALAPAGPESTRLLALSAANPGDLPLARVAAQAMLLDGDFNAVWARPKQARAAWETSRRLLATAIGGRGLSPETDRSKVMMAQLAIREREYPVAGSRNARSRSSIADQSIGNFCQHNYDW